MTNLRVMTFNIRGSFHRDSANIWERRSELNVRVIRRHAPDLIGFQEYQEGNRETYDDELAGYEYIPGPRYENRKPHAYNAIYWNPQRLQLLDAGGFWLSETPEEFSGSWGTGHKRSANWAKFRIGRAGVEFVHLNTHLDHKSIAARRQGARLIVRRLDDLAGGESPVVVTGDFNADPGSPVHRIFTNAGFGDAHLLAGNPPANTFHKFQGSNFIPRRPERERRLDWVLIRSTPELQPAETVCHVVRNAEPPIYPSDHYPVVADLSLDNACSEAI